MPRRKPPMSDWRCRCGAVNVAERCEVCGSDQPVAATPAVMPKDSTTQALLKRPLCEHVTEPGAMCAACRAEVDRMRGELRRTWGSGGVRLTHVKRRAKGGGG